MKTQQIHIELQNLATIEDFHKHLKQKLGFPDFYGANYPALVDCLSSLRFPDDQMTTVTLEKEEVLVLEIQGMSYDKYAILELLVFASQAVNERQVSRGDSPCILFSF